jgi:hypothetical protein
VAVPVFDQQFIDDLQRINATRPASYRPDLHFFATSPERTALREWIERTVALIPEPGRSGLISRLRSDDNFVTAISEVAVAAALHEAGLYPESELSLDGLTPDLFVAGTEDRVPIIFEVWTRQHKDGEPGRRRSWQALVEQVAKIPVSVGLTIGDTRKIGPPDRQQARQIARELRRWLLGADRPLGAAYEVLGYRFIVYGPIPGSLCAVLARPGEGGAFGSDVVLDVIRTKTGRYRDLAKKLRAAFVVVLGAQAGTPLDLETVRAALDGRQALTFLLPPALVGPAAEATVQLHREHRVPELDAALSAVAWVQAVEGNQKLHILDSPAAAVPLPELVGASITRERLPVAGQLHSSAVPRRY